MNKIDKYLYYLRDEIDFSLRWKDISNINIMLKIIDDIINACVDDEEYEK